MLSESILEIVKNNRHKFVGSLTHSKIRRVIDTIFKEYQIKTKIIRSKDIAKDDFFIGGYYQDFSVVLEISVSSKTDHLILTEKSVDNFLFVVAQVICHELIHYLQDLARSDHSPSLRHMRDYNGAEQQYLSDPDEIQAYAHDIAMELQRHYPNDVFGALRKIGTKRKSVSAKYYNKTFGKSDSKVRRRLLSHTYKWLTEKTWT
jgi:hypothetical protein